MHLELHELKATSNRDQFDGLPIDTYRIEASLPLVKPSQETSGELGTYLRRSAITQSKYKAEVC
jgi:hypothetical protein